MDSTQIQDTGLPEAGNSGEGVQPNSAEQFDPAKFEAELLSKVERMVQSTKDRRLKDVPKINERLSGIEKILTEYNALKGEGMSDAEIKREWRLRELESALLPEDKPQGAAVEGQEQEPDSLKLLSAFSLSPNDPEVVSVLRDNKDLPTRAAKLAAIAVKSKKPDASPATALPSVSAKPAPPQLEAQYKERLKAVRQGDVMAIVKLKKEFRDKGLNIS